MLFLSVLMLPLNPLRGDTQTDSDYAASNAGIENIQTSQRITGPASETVAASCVPQAVFKGNAESMLLVDPSNPNHLVGASHFIYKFATGGTFSGSVGVHISNDAGQTWENHLINGFDCSTFKGPKGQHVYRTYDPVVAMDTSGNLYAAILPDYSMGGAEKLDLYAAKSTDGGKSWSPANGGKLIFSSLGGSAGSADKEWIIVDNNPGSPHFGTIYVVWVSFYGYAIGSDILLSKSTDKGETFSTPVRVSPPHKPAQGYAWPIPAVAPDGTLYVNFIDYINCSSCNTLDEEVAKSSDGGVTFGAPVRVATGVVFHGYSNTTFRSGIYQSFVINPVNGHLLMALESFSTTGCPGGNCLGRKTDILLYESSDGVSWSQPLLVNDNPKPPANNQFQPVVAVSPGGLVAVAFYDRRLNCPNEAGVLPEDVGAKNVCIDVTLQFYTDEGSLRAVGRNMRVTKSSWDPNNSGSLGRGGKLAYIGDYFGLALTDSMAYPFFVANYDLGQNPAQDMQIFVARVKSPISITTSTTSSTVSSTTPTRSEVTTQPTTITTTTGQPQPFDLGSYLPVIAAVVGIAIAAVVAYLIMKKRKTSPMPS